MAEHWKDCDGNGWQDCWVCHGEGEYCGCFDDCMDHEYVLECPEPETCRECQGEGIFRCPGCAEHYEAEEATRPEGSEGDG